MGWQKRSPPQSSSDKHSLPHGAASQVKLPCRTVPSQASSRVRLQAESAPQHTTSGRQVWVGSSQVWPWPAASGGQGEAASRHPGTHTPSGPQ